MPEILLIAETNIGKPRLWNMKNIVKYFQGIRKVQNILMQTKKDELKRRFMNQKAKEEEENKSVITKFFKITFQTWMSFSKM